jgi:hypothetical protein
MFLNELLAIVPPNLSRTATRRSGSHSGRRHKQGRHAYRWSCRRWDDTNAEVVVDTKEDATAPKSKSEAIEATRSERCQVGHEDDDEVEGHDEVLADVWADEVAVNGRQEWSVRCRESRFR